jgi:2-polyprenyl-3-methyl-5-hydroxy-6-metoxy-1,4-benzoquinol methylase
MTTQQTIDEGKLMEFLGRMVGEMGAAISALMINIGDKLGLYKAMDGAGPLTSEEVAERTGTNERYVREWLSNQAAGGFVTYDPTTRRFTLPPEQALAFANEASPACLLGGIQIMASLYQDEAKFLEAFRTGKGVGWHEHNPELFVGTERFFRPGYNANLVPNWIPALEDVETKLKGGAKVADVGCGLGASTIVLAQAYPNASITGFDYHGPSIDLARQRAAEAGVGDRVAFEVSSAKEYPGTGYDLVAFFDCLHDMGDPVGAARHVRESLAPDGTLMLVEPLAADRLEDNLNPVGRLYYGASTVVCTPASLAQEVGLGLGAQAGEARLRDVLTQAGFTRIRRATETPFNMVLEVRP